ncbi:glucose-1-phosphate adenylyltransferase [mine drainage metagenome]|uniref:Glucose-1-phosphate adenylyltransferase n=1 Tax=mine drainage metagenome TaxID=410659 RepID=A0A1J5QVG8_9ZZZZ
MQQDFSSSRFVSALTKNTVALILSGGRGSRLKDLTNWRAKPAVPFGGKFRIIDFPLSNCMNSGIRRIGVVTQYKAHSLIQHIQRGWGFLRGEFNEFVELLPAQQRVQEEWYKGTADAVFQNLDILRNMGPEYILVLAGDHIYKMDYGQMLAAHVRNKADMTVACLNVPVEEARAFGVMGVDDHDRIITFKEKPANPDSIPGDPTQSLASMGIYVFNATFLYEQLIRDADDPDSVHDFGQDIIPHLISRYRVFAHRFADSCVNSSEGKHYWRDVGTVDAYWEANMELTKVTPELNLYDSTWPIWTYQAQLPPAKFVFDSDGRRGAAVDSLISGGCIISGSSVRRSVLFSDVRVHSYGDIEDSVILPNVTIGRNVTLKRVVIDKGTNIPEGMEVGINPEEDRKRFHVSEKGITLITPDMLGQSLHHAR